MLELKNRMTHLPGQWLPNAGRTIAIWMHLESFVTQKLAQRIILGKKNARNK